MTKKADAAFTISKSELAKLPRNEQRRMLELGYVQGEAAPSEKSA